MLLLMHDFFFPFFKKKKEFIDEMWEKTNRLQKQNIRSFLFLSKSIQNDFFFHNSTRISII